MGRAPPTVVDTYIDRVKILYAVGVVLGVVATFYFGFRILESLSPTTTSAVLFLGFVVFLFGGLYAEGGSLDTVFYALSAGSYLVFVAYILATYDLGDGGVFALLAGSSALFVGLGYGSSKGVLDTERSRLRLGVAAALLLAVALLGFDATGAQPSYEHDIAGEVDVPESLGSPVVVGATAVENPFVLSRRAELPTLTGCVYTPERRRVSVRHSDAPREVLLAGNERRTYDVTVSASAFFDTETRELRDAFADRGSVPVETADSCPEAADETKLVVATGGEDGPFPVPR